MEDAYEVLAAQIVDLSPEKYSSANLQIEAEDGFTSAVLTYVLLGAGEEKVQLPPLAASKVHRAVQKLRDNWPGGPFSRGLFRLFPNGQFEFEASFN